jgi:hypothetical protein
MECGPSCFSLGLLPPVPLHAGQADLPVADRPQQKLAAQPLVVEQVKHVLTGATEDRGGFRNGDVLMLGQLERLLCQLALYTAWRVGYNSMVWQGD